MNITKETIIGEAVAADYRTAAVFQKYHIDFCCKGNRNIREACENKNINMDALLDDLRAVTSQQGNEAIDFNAWPLDLLADYIEKIHHRYVEEKTAILIPYLDKLCKVHGPDHPELFEIRALFNASAVAMTAHMKKEELILFPFIKKMVSCHRTRQDMPSPQFGTVQNPVEMMMREHDAEGERFRKIAELSNDYNPPADACNTYRVTFSMLQDFESDLHRHVHLENNILFTKAIKLENKFNTIAV